MSHTPISFADVFPATTEAQWRARVDGVLKGAPFERLQGRSHDAIAIAPLYGRLLEERPRAVMASGAGWARLVRGSWRHGKPLRGAGAAWV